MLFSEIIEDHAYPVANLLVYIVRNANTAGFGQTFEARRNIHAVAINVVALNDHIAHLLEHVPVEALGNRWLSAAGTPTLGDLIVDYLRHLDHHLVQLLGKEPAFANVVDVDAAVDEAL